MSNGMTKCQFPKKNRVIFDKIRPTGSNSKIITIAIKMAIRPIISMAIGLTNCFCCFVFFAVDFFFVAVRLFGTAFLFFCADIYALLSWQFNPHGNKKDFLP